MSSKAISALAHAVLVAAWILGGSGRAAAADGTLALDVVGSRAIGRPALAMRHGTSAIRLTLDRGRVVWLAVSARLERLVAGDFDRDGDVDLVATTEAGTLVAWLNHGRGQFTPTAIDPAPPHPLGPRGPTLAGTRPSEPLPFGIGADGALPSAHRPAAPAASFIRPHPFAPPDQATVCAPFGRRAPPAA